jgi:hypothetical protein
MVKYLVVIGLIFFIRCSPSVESHFEKLTGLEITDSIKILKETDTYYASEGEWSINFTTNTKQINEWLSNNPPWSLKNWQRGEVEHQIGFHCRFGFDESVGMASSGDESFYSGNKKIIDILSDSSNYYAYEERCCDDEDLRYHNGSLLIINPRTKTVYFSVWDY